MKLFNLYDFEESHENDSVILGWWHTFGAKSWDDLPKEFGLIDTDGETITYRLYSMLNTVATYVPDDGMAWCIKVYS